MTADVETAVTQAFREEWGQVVATLIRVTGDWDLAEDCAQDAFAEALIRWGRDGLPRNPGAWLTSVARNRALDRLRRTKTETRKLKEIAAMAYSGDEPEETGGIADDRLRLIFTCCHPALALDARVALTLRTLAGLTTAEIARAFLIPESTMAKRLVRAKRKVRDAGIPYRVPAKEVLPQRTSGVLAVVYLLFNEGYSASAGADLVRRSLCDEAIRLARLLTRLLPNEPEVLGLTALLLCHDARRDARVDAAGELVTLEDQDRSRWDHAKIVEAAALLAAAGPISQAGPYRLQAAIAAGHATARTAADTDWTGLRDLYDRLVGLNPSPIVQLNRAVAVGMADGPQRGLDVVNGLAAQGILTEYYLLTATRADFLRRLGRQAEAAAAYRQALGQHPATEAECRYLARRLAEMTDRY